MTYKMTYKLGNKLFGGKPHTSSQELNEDSSHDCHLVLDQHGRRREDDLTEGEMKLDRRLDFVLQKSTMDQLTGTGFIMSHVTYWDSPDVAKFAYFCFSVFIEIYVELFWCNLGSRSVYEFCTN